MGETAKSDGRREVSRANYGAELRRLQGVVAGCLVKASACDEKAVPADETVGKGEDGQQFQVRWQWLRDALKKGADAKDKDRAAALESAGARLREEGAELTRSAAAVDDAAARRKVEEVLARREFGGVQETRWWQRVIARYAGRLQDWISRLAGAVPWAPWIGTAFEWGLLAAAAVGLLVWALRLGRQQRVSFAAQSVAAPAWQAESDDWAARARTEAAKGEWREAVHCLYWSAIVMLEGQRLWRQNRARTPREYVGLLEPGSARRRLLGGLTGVFERIWYGLRAATQDDYEKAAQLLEEMRVG